MKGSSISHHANSRSTFQHGLEGAPIWQMTQEVEMKRSVFNTSLLFWWSSRESESEKLWAFFFLVRFTLFHFARLEDTDKLEQTLEVIEHD